MWVAAMCLVAVTATSLAFTPATATIAATSLGIQRCGPRERSHFPYQQGCVLCFRAPCPASAGAEFIAGGNTKAASKNAKRRAKKKGAGGSEDPEGEAGEEDEGQQQQGPAGGAEQAAAALAAASIQVRYLIGC